MEQVEVEIEQEDGQGDPNPGLDLEQGNEDIEDAGAAIEEQESHQMIIGGRHQLQRGQVVHGYLM